MCWLSLVCGVTLVRSPSSPLSPGAPLLPDVADPTDASSPLISRPQHLQTITKPLNHVMKHLATSHQTLLTTCRSLDRLVTLQQRIEARRGDKWNCLAQHTFEGQKISQPSKLYHPSWRNILQYFLQTHINL